MLAALPVPTFTQLRLTLVLPQGSTYGRLANPKELQKNDPTFKDLDFRARHPKGLFLPKTSCDMVTKALNRDCRVRALVHAAVR